MVWKRFEFFQKELISIHIIKTTAKIHLAV